MATVRYRAFWGVRKREELLGSLDSQGAEFNNDYILLQPRAENSFSLRPTSSTVHYSSWAALNEISRATDWSGVLEKRRGALMDHDLERLRDRMALYCDPTITFAELRARGIGPVVDAAMFNAARARAALIETGGLSAGRFARISLYPFDDRWCFHTNVQPVWNRSRPEVAAQQSPGNSFLVTRARARRPDEGFPCFFTSALPGDHLLDPNVHPLPFVLHMAGGVADGLGLEGATTANLSARALDWCARLGLDRTADTSRLIWRHALAISYSQCWLDQNADAIKASWPRIPLPQDIVVLRASAALGDEVSTLLNSEVSVPSVTAGVPRPALASVAVPVTSVGRERDWRLTAGWGARSASGVTMPGRGKVDARPYAAGEQPTEAETMLLGQTTHDIWMNQASYWRNVPERVGISKSAAIRSLKNGSATASMEILGVR